ncbi:hypothetical protein E2E27_07430 [Porphyrobacter sp. YT40]|nr:hypothetical protein E2E27_07430 [Porphyrobacter sp. YT40]
MFDPTLAIVSHKGPTIMLASGKRFDLLDPASSEFDIEDIAHGLAHVCRYAGQCRRFYSVAEHSLLVSDTVEEFALEALMHDAAEAFIGDITRPLKQLLPDYKAIELAIEQTINERFGLWPEAKSVIKEADLRVLAAEQRQIMAEGCAEWADEAGIVPAEIIVQGLMPTEAKELFLRRFRHLTGAPNRQRA